ncbi:tRNA (adenine-N(1)-)-methyltransferase [Sarocladium implicatum]|nr:tRNA (adenine-N(1)-)-methyltransferase [Sarocladium implicatum]
MPLIKENDVVLIRQEGSRYARWHLSPALRPGRRVKLSYGASLQPEDLIGRPYHEMQVADQGGRRLEVQRPTLAGYVVHSKRIATPIYPQDAATIVSLLDLNPTRPGEEDEDDDSSNTMTVDSVPFEIFEAGTGMGSLTLHIARAIHAANPPVPRSLRSALPLSYLQISTPNSSSPPSDTSSPSSPSSSSSSSPEPTPVAGLADEDAAALESYRQSRRMVLHTLDRNEKHAAQAYKFVRDFRRAQYLPSIDFHTNTSISAFFSSRSSSPPTPFLSRAILDLPSAHSHALPVISSLLPSGLLVLFAPSISQIAEFQEWCMGRGLRLEKVLELPTTGVSDTMPDASGGRLWEVKIVKPRGDEGEDGKMVRVMRPKVGDRVAGGGFVAVFRKLGDEAGLSQQEEAVSELGEEESDELTEEK